MRLGGFGNSEMKRKDNTLTKQFILIAPQINQKFGNDI